MAPARGGGKRARARRASRRRGKLPSAEGRDDGGDPDVDDVQAELGAAAVQGRAAVGERAGECDVRVGRTSEVAPFVKGPLCSSFDGFSLHAAVVVAPRDRERLEKLGVLLTTAVAITQQPVERASMSGWVLDAGSKKVVGAGVTLLSRPLPSRPDLGEEVAARHRCVPCPPARVVSRFERVNP